MVQDITLDKTILEQYRNLTKYDKASRGTICKVIKDDDNALLYIQISDNEESPEWIQIGHLLEKAFNMLITNDKFIDICINLYTKEGGDVDAIIHKLMHVFDLKI